MVSIIQFVKGLMSITWILMTVTSQTNGASFQNGFRVKKSPMSVYCKNLSNMREYSILLFRIHCGNHRARPLYREIRQKAQRTGSSMSGKENPRTDVDVSSDTLRIFHKFFDILRKKHLAKIEPVEDYDVIPTSRRDGYSENQRHYSPVYLIKKWVKQNTLSK